MVFYFLMLKYWWCKIILKWPQIIIIWHSLTILSFFNYLNCIWYVWARFDCQMQVKYVNTFEKFPHQVICPSLQQRVLFFASWLSQIRFPLLLTYVVTLSNPLHHFCTYFANIVLSTNAFPLKANYQRVECCFSEV